MRLFFSLRSKLYPLFSNSIDHLRSVDVVISKEAATSLAKYPYVFSMPFTTFYIILSIKETLNKSLLQHKRGSRLLPLDIMIRHVPQLASHIDYINHRYRIDPKSSDCF